MADDVAVDVEFDSTQVVMTADGALTHQLQLRFPGLQVEPVGHAHVHSCRRSATAVPSIGPVLLDDPVRLSPRMRVMVTTQCPGEPRRSIPVWFKPDGFVEVWIASQDLMRGTNAGDSVLVRSRIAANQLQRPPFGGPAEALNSFRTRFPVAAGEVITELDLELAPAVQKGATVIVAVTQGKVSLRFNGIASQDGAIGQSIAIENPSSGEAFKAVVTSTNAVELGEM